MKVDGKYYRAVWMEGEKVWMINQVLLPFRFETVYTLNYRESCQRIQEMTVRGAGTIGATAGFAMAQAFIENSQLKNREIEDSQSFLSQAKKEIESTRPTARDLFYAVQRVYNAGMVDLSQEGPGKAACTAIAESQAIADEYVHNAQSIGNHGAHLIGENCNILTHCNAGWLALVDHGSALSPIFKAAEQGRKIHVWIDETRPRSQGARLTAWELYQENIPHTIIADNAAGLLMSQGKIDLVLTGADRIAGNGDFANKIGTLEKAILAKEYGVPFFVAAPLTTFDFHCLKGEDIIIEDRHQEEILWMEGPDQENIMRRIQVTNPGSPGYNPAFDVTPAVLCEGFITEKGIINRYDFNSILASND